MATPIQRQALILGTTLLALTSTARAEQAHAEHAHVEPIHVASTPPRTLVPSHAGSTQVQVERSRSLSRSLERGAHLANGQRFLGLRWEMPSGYGVEMESMEQFELRRKLFYSLAKLTGVPSFRGGAGAFPAVVGDRSVLEVDAQRRTRQRGTYTELEEIKGSSQHYISHTAKGVAASTGGALLTGAIAAKLFHLVPSGESFYARPNAWPTGIKLGGSFTVP